MAAGEWPSRRRRSRGRRIGDRADACGRGPWAWAPPRDDDSWSLGTYSGKSDASTFLLKRWRACSPALRKALPIAWMRFPDSSCMSLSSSARWSFSTGSRRDEAEAVSPVDGARKSWIREWQADPESRPGRRTDAARRHEGQTRSSRRSATRSRMQDLQFAERRLERAAGDFGLAAARLGGRSQDDTAVDEVAHDPVAYRPIVVVRRAVAAAEGPPAERLVAAVGTATHGGERTPPIQPPLPLPLSPPAGDTLAKPRPPPFAPPVSMAGDRPAILRLRLNGVCSLDARTAR